MGFVETKTYETVIKINKYDIYIRSYPLICPTVLVLARALYINCVGLAIVPFLGLPILTALDMGQAHAHGPGHGSLALPMGSAVELWVAVKST